MIVSIANTLTNWESGLQNELFEGTWLATYLYNVLCYTSIGILKKTILDFEWISSKRAFKECSCYNLIFLCLWTSEKYYYWIQFMPVGISITWCQKPFDEEMKEIHFCVPKKSGGSTVLFTEENWNTTSFMCGMIAVKLLPIRFSL